MTYILIALIVGLPISPLFFHKMDIWHACGFYTQLVVWGAFGFALWGSAKQRTVNNIPVMFLYLYAGLSTAFICYLGLITNRYNTGAFFPFFNFLTLLMLYYLIVNYVPKWGISFVISALEYVLIFNALFCVLQLYGFGQVTKLLYPISLSSGLPHSQMIGFIGNGTHLSAWIGMMLPVLFISASRRNILAIILCLLLLTQTGEINGNTSLTGWMIVALYLFILSFKNKIFIFINILFLSLITYISINNSNFISLNGRSDIWAKAIDYVQYHYPLTGSGLGTMNTIAGISGSPFFMWRHLHQEYLQFTIELGIIGLILIFNIILDLIKTRSRSWQESCLKMSFLGFLLSCCSLSSSHLWIMTTYSVIFYSLFKAVNEDSKWQYLQEKKSVTV